jgi:hypothetical protein
LSVCGINASVAVAVKFPALNPSPESVLPTCSPLAKIDVQYVLGNIGKPYREETFSAKPVCITVPHLRHLRVTDIPNISRDFNFPSPERGKSSDGLLKFSENTRDLIINF